MMKIRGMNLWPEAVDAVVLAHPWIDEYNGRVEVAGNGREVVRILVDFKPDAGAGANDRPRVLAQLQTQIEERTGVAVQVREAGPGEIERFAYKEKRWKDQRSSRM
jgi:phenylacetate-coenzyme A ligase PaaK-like adenylate-forming protein